MVSGSDASGLGSFHVVDYEFSQMENGMKYEMERNVKLTAT